MNQHLMDLPLELCAEYDGAARWCALRGLTGKVGDPLPDNMDSDGALKYINADPEAFQKRVKEFAYAIAMHGCRFGFMDGNCER